MPENVLLTMQVDYILPVSEIASTLDRLALRTPEAVVLEDSQAGVEAAAAAGLPVIALQHRFNAGHDFTKAVRVLPSLDDTNRVTSLIEQILAGRGAGETNNQA